MNRRSTGIAAVIGVAAAFASGFVAHQPPAEQEEMAEAARAFLASLSDEHRKAAQLEFQDPARLVWAFVPGDRAGLWLKDMSADERRAAHGLMRSVLSAQGYLKVHEIMRLDAVLREMERSVGGSGASRDPERYAFAVFGAPSAEKPWGWRLEGHHVSLNFTAGVGRTVAVTPTFLGANPAEVRQGPEAGLRVMAPEEDLARALLKSFTTEQRSRAVIAERAPADVLAIPGRGAEVLGEPAGIPVSEMSEAQQASLRGLIGVYVERFRSELAEAQLGRVNEEWNEIRFAWAGPAEAGKPHYYRIRGKRFVIEYDNTQNDANHVHTVWRDFENDFGDALLKHYETGHQ